MDDEQISKDKLIANLTAEKKDAIRELQKFVPFGRGDLNDGHLVKMAVFISDELMKRHADVANLKRDNDDLQRRLALAEQRRAEAEKLRATEVVMNRPQESGLPDLPDAYIRAAVAALDAFAEGFQEYGPGAADETGLAGQWGELHRKVRKLKPVMWDGEAERLTRETPQEVLRDIVGHCLLALEMYERGFEAGR
jgi:hypothetical protein